MPAIFKELRQNAKQTSELAFTLHLLTLLLMLYNMISRSTAAVCKSECSSISSEILYSVFKGDERKAKAKFAYFLPTLWKTNDC